MDIYRYRYLRKYDGEVLPSVEELRRAIIKILEENGAVSLDELRKYLKEYFWLTEADCEIAPDANGKSRFTRMVYKVVYSLYKHYLLERVKRGVYKLTKWGKEVAEQRIELSNDELKEIPVRPSMQDYHWPNSRERYWNNPDEFFKNDNVTLRELGIAGYGDNEPEETYYGLSEEEFERLYIKDTRFRNLIRTGRFVLHNGQVVPVRYYMGSGDYSSLAFEFIADGKFSVNIKKNYRTQDIYFDCVCYDSKPINYTQFITITRKPLDWDNLNVEEIIEQLIRELPLTTAEIFEYLRAKLGIKWQNLARVLGVSERALRYWKNANEDGKTEYDISLEKLIAICLALHLPPNLSKLIIERIKAKDKNGFLFDPDAAGREQRVWKFLLERHFLESTLEINEICRKNNIGELFSINEEDHQDMPKGAGRLV